MTSPPAAGAGYRVSLILPIRGVRGTLNEALGAAEAALQGAAVDYEILVIAGGGDSEVEQAVAGRGGRVRLVRPARCGYRAALLAGLAAARFDLVAVLGPLGSPGLHALEAMLPLSRDYAAVWGCRTGQAGLARLVDWTSNALARLLLGSPVHDINCPLKLFRRESVPALAPQGPDGLVDTELLAAARAAGLAVGEVAVPAPPAPPRPVREVLRRCGRGLAALLSFWWSRQLFPASANRARLDGRWWASLLLLAVVTSLLLFSRLSYPLVEPDEGRHAEIGQEMLDSGNWLAPTFNHEPYHNKPALFYWLIAGSLWLFGPQEWAVRLVPAGAALLTVLATFVFASRQIGTRRALVVGLVLGLSGLFLLCARFLVVDSIVCLLVCLSLYSGHTALASSRLRKGWWAAAAFGCGAAMLAKGLVPLVLIVPPLLLYARLDRGAAVPRWRHWLLFAGLALAAGAPWYLAMMVRQPAFAYQFFVDHHLKRFFDSGGAQHHPRPVWFYLPVLLLGLMPWSLLVGSLARFLFSRAPAVAAGRPRVLGFCLLWAGWGLFFLSLSGGKLPTYVLPLVPPLAVVIGFHLDRVLFEGQAAGRRAPLWALWLLGASFVVAAGWAWLRGLVGPQMGAVLLGAALLSAAAVVVLARRCRALSARGAWALCGGAALVALVSLTQGLVPAWASHRSPLASQAELEAMLGHRDVPVVCFGESWGSLHFHLHRAGVLAVEQPHDLVEMQRLLLRQPRTLLIVKDDVGPSLARSLLPAGRRITRVVNSGKVRLVLVEPACSPAGLCRH